MQRYAVRVSVALFLVLSLVGGRVQAQGNVEEWPTYDDGEVFWSYRPIPGKDECTIALTRGERRGISGEVVIPGEVKDGNGKTYRVVKLYQDIFESGKITKVVVPEEVTTIGSCAFQSSMVESVVLPSTLREIEFCAFIGCSKLSSITIPEGVKKVEYNTFERCNSLRSVTLPNSINTIEESAFEHCSKLRSIELPSSVKEIGKKAFCSSGLEVLPNIQGVKVINEQAFVGLNLTLVRIPEGVKKIDINSFSGCSRLAQLTIPSSVDSIEKGAFALAWSDAQAAPNYSVYFLAGEDCVVDKEAFPAKEKFQGSKPKLYVKEGKKTAFEGKDWVKYTGFEVEEVGDDKYLVTFDARGGAPQPSMVMVSKDGKVSAPKDKEGKDIRPEKEGYEFLGWYDQEDTTTKYDFGKSKVQKNITLVAKWRKKEFVVVIVNGLGSKQKVYKRFTGDVVERPTTLKRGNECDFGGDKYSFEKWLSTGSKEVKFPVTVTRDTVIWAVWTKLIQVTFDVQGGKLYSSFSSGKQLDTEVWVRPGNTIQSVMGMITGERKKGEFLKGLYLNGEPYNTWDEIHSELTLEAKWAKNCVVTFNVDGGTPVPPEQTVAEGEKVKVPSQDPTKDNYVFKGWYLGEDLFSFGTTEVKGDITLVAKWAKECKVTFDANGGVDEPDDQLRGEGETVAKPSQDPSKEGYVFKGWFVGEVEYDFNQPIKGDLTIKAKWAKVCKVTFNADGGKPSPEEQKVEEGGKVTRPSLDPSKEGYWFSGWFVDGKPYDFNGAVAGDFEIVAQWYKKATAVESVLLSEVQVAPNPIGEELVLQGAAAAERVEVYSIDGVLVYSGLATGSEREVIALPGLRSGAYLVRVVAQDGEKVLRVVKK